MTADALLDRIFAGTHLSWVGPPEARPVSTAVSPRTPRRAQAATSLHRRVATGRASGAPASTAVGETVRAHHP